MIYKAELWANHVFHTPCPDEGVLMSSLCRSPLQTPIGTIWPCQDLVTICWCLVPALVIPKACSGKVGGFTSALMQNCFHLNYSNVEASCVGKSSNLMMSSKCRSGSFFHSVKVRQESSNNTAFPLYTLSSGQSIPSDGGDTLAINTCIFKCFVGF